MITKTHIQKLSDYIIEYLKEDFETIHLSQNLADTIIVSETQEGFRIEIPAEMYDIAKFRKEGVVVYTGGGSYAEEVNKTGGFSKLHKGYVENAIIQAIQRWVQDISVIGGVSYVEL